MALEIGAYRTKAGSTVDVLTRNAGSWRAEFDWFEEPGACIDCRCVDVDHQERTLVWECEVCGGGSAALMPVKE